MIWEYAGAKGFTIVTADYSDFLDLRDYPYLEKADFREDDGSPHIRSVN